MKKISALILVLVMVSALTACGGSSASESSNQANPVTLKATLSGNDTSPTYVAMSEFKRLIEERTDGRYLVEIYPNDQLSSSDQPKGCEMLMDGSAEIEMHSSLVWATYVPDLQVISFPFLFSSYEDADEKVLDPESEGYALVTSWMGEKNVHTIGLCEQGFRQITNSKHEILAPEDIQGLKMRIPSNPLYVDMFDLLGASASPMSFSEVYTALQQGAIDGQENPYSATVVGKFEEVQDYLTEWNYSYDVLLLNVSDKVWQKLSDEDKAIFEACGREACEAEIKASREADGEFKQAIADAGVRVTELSDVQHDAFVEACMPMYEMYRDTFGEDTFATFGYQF